MGEGDKMSPLLGILSCARVNRIPGPVKIKISTPPPPFCLPSADSRLASTANP